MVVRTLLKTVEDTPAGAAAVSDIRQQAAEHCHVTVVCLSDGGSWGRMRRRSGRGRRRRRESKQCPGGDDDEDDEDQDKGMNDDNEGDAALFAGGGGGSGGYGNGGFRGGGLSSQGVEESGGGGGVLAMLVEVLADALPLSAAAPKFFLQQIMAAAPLPSSSFSSSASSSSGALENGYAGSSCSDGVNATPMTALDAAVLLLLMPLPQHASAVARCLDHLIYTDHATTNTSHDGGSGKAMPRFVYFVSLVESLVASPESHPWTAPLLVGHFFVTLSSHSLAHSLTRPAASPF